MSKCTPYCGTLVQDRSGRDIIFLCPACETKRRKGDEMLKELERNDTSNWGDEIAGRYIQKADGSVIANDEVRERQADIDIDDWLDCDEPWD